MSPLTSSSLHGVGLDMGVWVCVTLVVECSVCRRVINYHAGTILGSGREQLLGGQRLIHHCDQHVLVLEGLCGFELGFEFLPRMNKVFSYEIHYLHLRSMLGPALLEQSTVTGNRLEENLPREDIKRLTPLTPIYQTHEIRSMYQHTVISKISCSIKGVQIAIIKT